MAFFQQGVNERNIHWQYPTISDTPKTFDGLHVLPPTHRNDGFTAILELLRDHLRPEDSSSSSFLLGAPIHSIIGQRPPQQARLRGSTMDRVRGTPVSTIFPMSSRRSMEIWKGMGSPCQVHDSPHLNRRSTTTPPWYNAFRNSRGFSTQLEIRWNANGFSATHRSSGEEADKDQVS